MKNQPETYFSTPSFMLAAPWIPCPSFWHSSGGNPIVSPFCMTHLNYWSTGPPTCRYIAVRGRNMLNYCMWNGILSNYRQLLPAMVIYLAELRTWRLRANIHHRHSHSVRRAPVLPALSPNVESLPFFSVQRLTSANIARCGFFFFPRISQRLPAWIRALLHGSSGEASAGSSPAQSHWFSITIWRTLFTAED